MRKMATLPVSEPSGSAELPPVQQIDDEDPPQEQEVSFCELNLYGVAKELEKVLRGSKFKSIRLSNEEKKLVQLIISVIQLPGPGHTGDLSDINDLCVWLGWLIESKCQIATPQRQEYCVDCLLKLSRVLCLRVLKVGIRKACSFDDCTFEAFCGSDCPHMYLYCQSCGLRRELVCPELGCAFDGSSLRKLYGKRSSASSSL